MEKIAKILLIVMLAMSLLIGANRHGKEKTGEDSFWYTLGGNTIIAILFYFAGIFDL